MYVSSPLTSCFSPAKDLRVSRNTTFETAAESPYQARVKSIGKRFNDLQCNIEVSQNIGKSEQIETKIRRIDENITENYRQTEEKLRICTNEVSKLEENMAAEIISRELFEERYLKEINLVESNLALELRNEVVSNKDAQKRVATKAEEKIKNMRNNFFENSKKIDETRQEQTHLIAEQVSALQAGIKQEQNAREQAQDTIVRSVSSKIAQIQNTIATERKLRNETERFLFQKIEQINNSLQNQAANERERRESAESQMLKLLEQACGRYEDRVRSWVR